MKQNGLSWFLHPQLEVDPWVKTYWCVLRREWMGMGVAGMIINSYPLVI